MANKYVALLLVVCLIAAASVDAQNIEENGNPCYYDCVSSQCGNPPSTFCKMLCGFACSTGGLAAGKLICLHICVIFVYRHEENLLCLCTCNFINNYYS